MVWYKGAVSACPAAAGSRTSCPRPTRTTASTSARSAHGLARSNAYTAPGDSGGPWFNGGYAIGMTSGSAGGWGYFQPVLEALQYYGLWVL